MKQIGIALSIMILSGAFAVASPPAAYSWSFTEPSQLTAYRAKGAVLTVAEVHLTNGCQTGFIVPTKMKFAYEIKIRTKTGPIMCTQIDQHVLLSFIETGNADVIHAHTASEKNRSVTVVDPSATSAK